MLLDADGGWGELTFWLMIMVTMPLEFTRAVMFSVTPVLWLDTVLVNSELPPDCTPPTACEVSTGTWSPTFSEAGMLSVAMMLGAEITRVYLLVSDAVTAASSSWLRSTSAPVMSATPPAPEATFRMRPAAPDEPEFFCSRYAVTPAANAPFKSI